MKLSNCPRMVATQWHRSEFGLTCPSPAAADDLQAAARCASSPRLPCRGRHVMSQCWMRAACPSIMTELTHLQHLSSSLQLHSPCGSVILHHAVLRLHRHHCRLHMPSKRHSLNLCWIMAKDAARECSRRERAFPPRHLPECLAAFPERWLHAQGLPLSQHSSS